MASRPPHPDGADRFSEDRATYSLKGNGEQPDLAAGVAAIREVVQTLKPKPGVYRMQDARGDVLYVGKARALKNRVANYTQVDRLTLRLKRMVSQTRSMTIITTNSEAEALLLEAQLIKRYRPAYNVLLRDDKSFPFILLRADHEFPRITKHRGARKAKGNYYGPFASAGSVNTTINALQKLFLLRSCSDSYFSRRDRPCLLYQIKRCSAPCVGRIDEAGYAELVSEAKDFLGGKSSAVQAKIGAQMNEAAEGSTSRGPRCCVIGSAPRRSSRGARRSTRRDLAAPTFLRWPAGTGKSASRPSSSAAARIGAIVRFFPPTPKS
jgi:excinuclease ABC subunit C